MRAVAIVAVLVLAARVAAAENAGILERSIDAAMADIATGKLAPAMTEVRVGINCHFVTHETVGPALAQRVRARLGDETDAGRRAALGVCLAVVQIALRDIDGAIATLDAAVDDAAQMPVGSSLPEVFNTRGVCFAAKRDVDRAVADYRRAIALNDHYVDALRNLAQALARTGDTAGASAAMERAERLVDPVTSAPPAVPAADAGR